jgi:ABC-type uncharacterized transport system substrate-binding protein
MLHEFSGIPVRHLVVILVALAVSACAIEPNADGPVDVAAIPIEPPPEPLPEIPLEPARSPQSLLPPPVEQRPPLAIVVSGQQSAYTDVADELSHYYVDAAIFQIAGNEELANAVMRSVNDIGSRAVVAIGLLAARAAIDMTDSPVVYAQVFNHGELNLERPDVRGVAAYSPLAEQLAAWRKYDPELNRVGLIVGEGHDALVEEAREAADLHGVDLTVRITHSDQETLYAFRRMSREIDGFWLFPDSRVLSARALRDMAEIAERNRVRFAVPNEGMLALGTAVALTTVASDIAAVIVDVLEKMQRGEAADVPRLSGLREVDVKTGGTVADAR